MRTAALAAAVVGIGLGTGAPESSAVSALVTPQALQADRLGARNEGLAVGRNGFAAAFFEASTGDNFSSQVFVAIREGGEAPSTIRPRGFGRPVAVSGAPGGVGHVEGAFDANGNLTIAWTDGVEAGDFVAYTAYRPAYSAWQAPVALGPVSKPGLSLAVADDGSAALSNADGALYHRGAWSGDQRWVRSTQIAGAFQVAMNRRGDLAVLLGSPDSADPQAARLSVRVRPAGAGEGKYSFRHEVGLRAADRPDLGLSRARSTIAIADDGTVAVAWFQGGETYGGGGEPLSVAAAYRTPGPTVATGTWTAAGKINVGTDLTPYQLSQDRPPPSPAAYVAGPGRIAITWTEGSARRQRTFPGPAASELLPAYSAYALSPGRSGTTLLVPAENSPSREVKLKTRLAFGSAFTEVGPEAVYDTPFVAFDELGHAYISSMDVGDEYGAVVRVTAYDPVAPVIESVTVPATAVPKSAVSMSTYARDRISRWSARWDFGDGTSGYGAVTTHQYAKPGSYQVTATVTDEAGNATTSPPKTIAVAVPLKPIVNVNPRLLPPTLVGNGTLVRSLLLSNLVRGGDQVTITCTGDGCLPIANQAFVVAETVVEVDTPFGPSGLSLAPGAVLKVTIARAGHRTQNARFTMNAGEAPTRVLWY